MALQAMTATRLLARFGVVGVLTALLHYGLLAVGVELFSLSALLASSLGFVAAVLFNYQLHYHWTFASPAPHGRTAIRYGVMISCGFLINAAVMYAALHWLGLNYLLAQACALAFVVLWNFMLSALWVFRP